MARLLCPARKGNIRERRRMSYFMRRTEANFSRCGAHLGHVFDDDPKLTGQGIASILHQLNTRQGKNKQIDIQTCRLQSLLVRDRGFLTD
jgi:peptide methionine sulfoxide reductase MsrB